MKGLKNQRGSKKGRSGKSEGKRLKKKAKEGIGDR